MVLFLNLGNWFAGGIWKQLEICIRERLECCKQSLMGDSCGSSEEQNAYRNEDCDGKVHEGRNWTRGYLCYILAKNLSIFYLCPETE
jgi:hypothetical protein